MKRIFRVAARVVNAAAALVVLGGAVLIGDQLVVATWWHGAVVGTATLADEEDCDAGTSNQLSIALHFSGANPEPICSCMDINAAAKNCNLTAQPSATAATAIGSGGATDVLCIKCRGLK